MSSVKSLNKYIKVNLPDLLLSKPLFYNSKIGIRFEIGDPSIGYYEKRYMEGVYIRSIMLFERLFYPDTDIYIVVNSLIWINNEEDKNQGKDGLRKYLRDGDLCNEIDYIELPYMYNEEDEEIRTLRYCLSCKVKDIDHRRLLKAIDNQDMGIKPSFDDEVFFINKNNHIVYHLYDDRGLDVVSNKVSTLEKIYLEYNKWILDYDRKIIDKTFEKIKTT